jgi:hypothetical protein
MSVSHAPKGIGTPAIASGTEFPNQGTAGSGLTLERFAASRGFTEQELKEYGIRTRGEEVIIPCLGRAGAHYERIHRPHGKPKYESPAGVSSHLYNPAGIGPQSQQVWIAEGEFDTLSLLVAGTQAVGVLGAGNFRREWALLFESAEVTIAFDPDQAGDTHADKLMALFANARRFRVPEPYGDLNDWFKADYDSFEEAVKAW